MKNTHKISAGNIKVRVRLGDLSTDWRIILKWILKNSVEYLDWIHLARDRDQWAVLVNTAMKTLGNFLNS
jgi:hypothetical protein